VATRTHQIPTPHYLTDIGLCTRFWPSADVEGRQVFSALDD